MTRNATKQNNSVHLEGIINQVNTTEDTEGVTTAYMVVGTQDRQVDKETRQVRLVNPHNYRVMVHGATGEHAKMLGTLAGKDFMNDRTYFTLDGSLKTSRDGVTYISTAPENFKIVEQINYRNNRSTTVMGEVKETSINQGYAMLLVNVDNEADVRIKVSKEDQPRTWADIASGKIHAGTMMTADGKLRTPPMNAGAQSIGSAFVDATRCEQIALTKRQSETKKTGPSV